MKRHLTLAFAAALWIATTAPVDAAGPSTVPLPVEVAPASSHAPFEADDCAICHVNAERQNPGPLREKEPELCLSCHEEFVAVLKRPNLHRRSTICSRCHNPHNAAGRKLLHAEPRLLCTNCHDDIGEEMTEAKVPHGAMTAGKQCVACHDPHGSSVANLLISQPFDLCLSCHDVDTMKSQDGHKLENTRALLDTHSVWHGPVASKDCGACHQPHGSKHFRLLVKAYPPEFYAPYDAKTYELCFSCHREAAYSTAKTTTLTRFRDGDVNLHYLHLQQGGRGRTCRACHEVHASRQDTLIRDGVPYGSSGWQLKLNFRRAPTGGSCEKTCHQRKSYDYGPSAAAPPKTTK